MSKEPDLWLSDRPLVLASTSATRLKLLTAAGIPCRTVAPDVDERAIEAGFPADLRPVDVALELATAKALAVSRQLSGEMVLGGDQTLAVGERRLSKATTLAEAAEHLRILSDTTHELHSAAALVRDGQILYRGVDTARLRVRPLSDRFIEAYLAAMRERALASVGGYQIEGLGIHLFERVDGEHGTILGLPLLDLLRHFRARNLVMD